MFYNGFNMLIDLIIALTVSWAAYSWGWRDGYHNGASAEADIRDAFENYYLSTTKENDNA